MAAQVRTLDWELGVPALEAQAWPSRWASGSPSVPVRLPLHSRQPMW